MKNKQSIHQTFIENNASVLIDGQFMKPGIYAYTLVIDGVSVETKTMVVSK